MIADLKPYAEYKESGLPWLGPVPGHWEKGQVIEHAELQRLKRAGLVEGRYPNAIVAGALANATGEAARHIREQGFNKQYYVDLVLALLKEYGPVGRREIDELLLPKLPDRLSDQQKRRKVHNLRQELRRADKIANQGSRAVPKWVILWAHPTCQRR